MGVKRAERRAPVTDERTLPKSQLTAFLIVHLTRVGHVLSVCLTTFFFPAMISEPTKMASKIENRRETCLSMLAEKGASSG